MKKKKNFFIRTRRFSINEKCNAFAITTEANNYKL